MEQARQELNNLQFKYELSHPAVLHQSMVLDELINEFNRCSSKGLAKKYVPRSAPVNEEAWLARPLRLSFV
jgi:hypothetical protein